MKKSYTMAYTSTYLLRVISHRLHMKWTQNHMEEIIGDDNYE